MALMPSFDLSAARWIAADDQSWQRLAGFGPPGFAAYARLRFLPDPAFEGQSENDVDLADDAPTETAQLRAALEVLARHTRTPDDCYFCLWDGWGRTVDAPKVAIPNRGYFLFHGPVSDLGDWGAVEGGPGGSSIDLPDPALIWPADHAWCVANDVDPHWAGIGASTAAIDQLVADPRLDVVLADPDESQPSYW